MAKALLVLETTQEGVDFLTDIFTEQELEYIPKRWQVIRLLLAGETQRKIQTAVGASSHMTSRSNRRVVKHGTGMAKIVWSRLETDS